MPTPSEMMAQRLEKFARYVAKGMSETKTLTEGEREELRRRIRLTFRPTTEELRATKRKEAEARRKEIRRAGREESSRE